MAALVDLMHNAEKDETRLAACNSLLDRGYGKPTQAIEAGVSTQVNTQVNLISDEERLAAVMTLFARVENGVGAGDDEATDFLTSGQTSCPD